MADHRSNIKQSWIYVWCKILYYSAPSMNRWILCSDCLVQQMFLCLLRYGNTDDYVACFQISESFDYSYFYGILLHTCYLFDLLLPRVTVKYSKIVMVNCQNNAFKACSHPPILALIAQIRTTNATQTLSLSLVYVN